MASLPSSPSLDSSLNGSSFLMTYSIGRGGELKRVDFGDETTKGSLSIEFDAEQKLRVEVTDSKDGTPRKIESIFIRNIGSQTSGPVRLEEYFYLERCQILNQLHSDFDESRLETSMRLFLTFDGDAPELTIERQGVQQVNGPQERPQNLVLRVNGEIKQASQDKVYWYFKINENDEGQQSSFSIFMRDEKPEFELINQHGRKIPLTASELRYRSTKDGTRKRYDLFKLSLEDQSTIFSGIKSKAIVVGFSARNLGFNLSFSTTDKIVSEEILRILNGVSPSSIEEDFNHPMIDDFK